MIEHSYKDICQRTIHSHHTRRTPKIFHTILISKDGKMRPEMTMLHYCSLKSIRFHHPTWVINLYVTKGALPTGIWYERAKFELDIVVQELDSAEFDEYMGSKIEYFTHKTDVLRLIKLQEVGGVYIDLDVLVLNSFEPLRITGEYIATREDDADRLGSGVMISPPNNTFLTDVAAGYRTFRSKGRDEYFVETIQERPFKLLTAEQPSNVLLVKCDALLAPKTLQTHLGQAIYFDRFFERDDFDITDRFSVHIWTELNSKYVNKLSLDMLKLESETKFSSTFNRVIFDILRK